MIISYEFMLAFVFWFCVAQCVIFLKMMFDAYKVNKAKLELINNIANIDTTELQQSIEDVKNLFNTKEED